MSAGSPAWLAGKAWGERRRAAKPAEPPRPEPIQLPLLAVPQVKR